MTAPLRDFFTYNLWANLRLLDACASLEGMALTTTLPGTYGSIGDTWLHVAQGEEGYVARFTGQPPTPSLRGCKTFPGFAVLREHLKQSGEGLIAIVEQLDPTRLLGIEYDGQIHEIPVAVVLIQAVVHGVDHRSQIATILSQQGMVSPEVSGWTYFEEAIAPTQSP